MTMRQWPFLSIQSPMAWHSLSTANGASGMRQISTSLEAIVAYKATKPWGGGWKKELEKKLERIRCPRHCTKLWPWTSEKKKEKGIRIKMSTSFDATVEYMATKPWGHTHTHTRTRARARTHTHKETPTDIVRAGEACLYTHTRTHARAHTHMHACKHTPLGGPWAWPKP